MKNKVIKKFWDFVKELWVKDNVKVRKFLIAWTGKTIIIGTTNVFENEFFDKYQDNTATLDDFKEYFDSQNIPYKEHSDSIVVYVPEDISQYAPDEKVTDTMLASFTYYYSKDKKMPVYCRLDNPDRYPEKLDWNSGRITIHCYVSQNPMFYVKKKIMEEVEKITPQFIEMGKIAYKDENIFNQKLEQFQEQTKSDLFLRGWVMQKTMKNWKRILDRLPGWKVGDIMMDSYEVYGLND